MSRLFLTASFLALAVAGCSSGPGNSPTGDVATISMESVGSTGTRPAAVGRSGIADAPDRGDLVRYDAVRRVQSKGAYTAYPVTLSEAHAYKALAGGELVFGMPDGQALHLRADRHEDYGDGNWTLVARDRDGSSALLTFGQDAVFGSVTRADGSVFRLTTQRRQVYLVAADPAAMAKFENPGAAGRTDVLIPPAGYPVLADRPVQAAGATSEPVATTALGPNDIDVLMGYSSGLVARIGSEPGAVTRMQNLVAITNEAYQNSGVTMRLRLVRSMLVNYTDNTTNEDALQKMTGSNGSGSIPVDPAFNALRAAREESGADLVALIRQFREPEQSGCGIAWLIGGGQSSVTTASAPFGYSVSSDGSDDGFFCRDETFAHETGHNFGQQHNREDSSGRAGAHAYSYGYRESITNGFYTVMSYRLPDSSQTPIRYFANPAVSFQGRPTGVANDTDNVRSMNQTMPIIAGFRAEVGQPQPPTTRAPAPHDVNADGRSDVYLRGGTAFAAWGMNGTVKISDGYLGDGGSGWRFVGFGNFDNAGGSDLLWASATSMKVWFNDGRGRYVVYPIGNYGNGYSPIGTADINGDGKSDILLAGGSALAYWLMDSTVRIGDAYAGNGGANAKVVAVADFDANGASDLVWANGSTITMWLSQRNGAFTVRTVGNYGNGYSPVGAGDVNGDGRMDIVLTGGSAMAYWAMSGSTVLSTHYAGDGGPGFRLFAVADYNGDGSADIAWQNGSQVKLWMNNGAGSYTPTIISNYICCWAPEGGLFP